MCDYHGDKWLITQRNIGKHGFMEQLEQANKATRESMCNHAAFEILWEFVA